MYSRMHIYFLIVFISYVILSWATINVKWHRVSAYKNTRKFIFLLLNLFFTYFSFYYYQGISIYFFFLYIFILIVFYLLLAYDYRKNRLYAFAFFFPILWLIIVKATHWSTFVGVSYMAFRLSYLVYEVHLKKVAKPGCLDYLTFSFFTPTFLMGPISPYQYYSESVSFPNRRITPLPVAISRIIVGLTKLFVLSNFFAQLSFKAVWFDGNPHGIRDFFVSCIASYFYIYFNFSGYSDVAVGVAAGLNIRVKENFDYPFLARNMIELWRRWHISLSEYLRDVFFTPFTLWAYRRFSYMPYNFVVSISLFLTFILNGFWHGVTVNFFIVGILNGLGIVATHCYTVWVDKQSMKIRKILNENKIICGLGMLTTFFYFSLICFFFLSPYEDVKKVFYIIGRYYDF